MVAQAGVARVVLVDDHSADSTLALAKSVAAFSDRLTVLSAPDLPDGWVGKSHALYCGAQYVETKYVLFSDADVTISPGTVSDALSMMESSKLDHLSGLFRIRCETTGEKICAPLLAISASITLSRAAPISGSATGSFNMFNAELYRKMGGHWPIRHAIIDDVSLARLACSHGARSVFLDLSANVSVRLFKGATGFFSAVARSTHPYLRGGSAAAILGGISLSLFGALAAVNPLVAWIMLFTRGSSADGLTVASVVVATSAYVLGVSCVCEVHRYHDGCRAWGVFFPFAVVLLGAGALHSGLLKVTGRRVRWRGREYELR